MEESALEKLKKRLYAKNADFGPRKKRVRIYGRKTKTVPSEWAPERRPERRKRLSPIKLILLLSSLLVVIFAFIIVYFWALDIGFISSQNIGLEIKGPSYIEGGKEVVLNILMENRNSDPIELVDLILDFPEGAYSLEGKSLSHQRYSIGSIDSGQSVRKRISLVLFGREGELKKISAELEYRLSDSNAIFVKDASYEVKINQPAVGVSISMPERVNIKREIELEVGIVSNAEATIRDAFLNVDYPPGFIFKDSDIEPSDGENIWRLGDLAPLQERKLKIRGIMEGQDEEERAFHASVGVKDDEGNVIVFGSGSKTITLKKPYLDLSLFSGNEEVNDMVVYSGDVLRFQVFWQNNLDVPVKDAKIELKLDGTALDESSLSVSNGYYRSFDNSIVWNSSSLASLSLIKPQENGRANFTFKIMDPLPVSQKEDKNFSISLRAVIEGDVILEGSPSHIKNEIQKEIKIGSRAQLAASALHYSGVFKNSGPMPPMVGKETTYTIVWSVGGAVNDIVNVSVKSSLPSYVRWVGKVSPEEEDISFNENTGEIKWKIGTLEAGTGSIMPAREVSFQISFLPSVAQVNDMPILIEESVFEGRDSFTNKVVKDIASPLNTRLIHDPKFIQGEERVVR